MKKKITIVVAIVMVLLVCLVAILWPKTEAYNDGTTGKCEFKNLRGTVGYGISLAEGESEITVNVSNGKATIKIIGGGKELASEELSGESSKTLKVETPAEGMYLLSIYGKWATGTINYPVVEIEQSIDEMPLKTESNNTGDTDDNTNTNTNTNVENTNTETN